MLKVISFLGLRTSVPTFDVKWQADTDRKHAGMAGSLYHLLRACAPESRPP